MTENETAKSIVDAACHVHVIHRIGLLESVCQEVMVFELRKHGLNVLAKVPVPIVWDDLKFEKGFEADLIVEVLVIVELKSVEAVHSVHKKQVLIHLRLSDKRLGLLINFGGELIKLGISRVANGLVE